MNVLFEIYGSSYRIVEQGQAVQWGAQPRGSKGDHGHDVVMPGGHRVQYSILPGPVQGTTQ